MTCQNVYHIQATRRVPVYNGDTVNHVVTVLTVCLKSDEIYNHITKETSLQERNHDINRRNVT
jgi:hypothetical protein